MVGTLEALGKIAGFGGLVIGVFLLLFREVIRKNVFSNLTKEQSYKTIRLFLILAWSFAIVGLGVWLAPPLLQGQGSEPGKLKPVVLMDSTLRDVVYDIEDFKVGRTNADSINEILDGIPGINLHKETTNLKWDREEEVLKMDPKLIVMHISCFYDTTNIEDGQRKFFSFLTYMANSNIKFIIYSRGFHHGSENWKKVLVKQIPALKDRIHVLELQPEGTFDDPTTRRQLKTLVKEVLDL